MATKSTVKTGPEIAAKLYEEFATVAKKNGQSQRRLLEKAIEHYIHNVVPSQHFVRPEVIDAYRRSNEKLRDLYQRLAKYADRVDLTIAEILAMHQLQIEKRNIPGCCEDCGRY
jgi:hypothetical protein